MVQDRKTVAASVQIEYPARHMLNFICGTKGVDHHFVQFFYFSVGCCRRLGRDLPSFLVLAIHGTGADIAKPADSMPLCGRQKAGGRHDVRLHHRLGIRINPCGQIIGTMDDRVNWPAVSISAACARTQSVKVGPVLTVELDQLKICVGRNGAA